MIHFKHVMCLPNEPILCVVSAKWLNLCKISLTKWASKLLVTSSRIDFKALSHPSQGPWPCNYGGPWFSSKSHTMSCHEVTVVELTWCVGMSLSLGGRLSANSSKPWNNIHSLPCKSSCRLFVHGDFFGPLGLHLLVWSELERSRPFQPMSDLWMQWLRAFIFVCEVALN